MAARHGKRSICSYEHSAARRPGDAATRRRGPLSYLLVTMFNIK
jgi:hypothetical protein